jgi:hypothetical protein
VAHLEVALGQDPSLPFPSSTVATQRASLSLWKMPPSADPLLASYSPSSLRPLAGLSTIPSSQDVLSLPNTLIRRAFLTYGLATLGTSGNGVQGRRSMRLEPGGLQPDPSTGSSPEAARLGAKAPHSLD